MIYATLFGFAPTILVSTMAYDENIARRVRGLLAGRAGIVEKPLMGGLAFMAKDVMFCSVSGRGGLLVRVEPSLLEAALREPFAERADIGGRMMSGFVRVQVEGLGDDAALRGWVDRGLAAAAAVAAKPKTKLAAAKRRPPR